MLTDSHCHPLDLSQLLAQAEDERRRLGVAVLASACNMEEFLYNEELSKKAAAENAAPVLPCFAVHPQAVRGNGGLLETLDKLAGEGRLAAVGECGFDLFNAAFRETEAQQDKVFTAHLKAALCYDLPVIIHARRAMHKIFFAAKALSKCKAVIFHSWPGTFEEGESLLRRGINAYFSFGNTVINRHKKAIRSCALLPVERLLTETDAPYQQRRGENFSKWSDLPYIVEEIAKLRGMTASGLENQVAKNFLNIFKESTNGANAALCAYANKDSRFLTL